LSGGARPAILAIIPVTDGMRTKTGSLAYVDGTWNLVTGQAGLTFTITIAIAFSFGTGTAISTVVVVTWVVGTIGLVVD
jgi:hypothetical protein